MRLGIVTATLDQGRAEPCLLSWGARAAGSPPSLYIVDQDPGYYIPGPPVWASPGEPVHVCSVSEILGVVPAFAFGVQKALEDGCEIIACFHDDLLIEEQGWDEAVLDWFSTVPECGLAGFGGGTGLADDDIYQSPYNPMQLARKDFVSNMRDADAHGRRGVRPEQAACFDGFSQIGRRDFWRGIGREGSPLQAQRRCPRCKSEGFRPGALAGQCSFCDGSENDTPNHGNLFQVMADWGIVHHAYDSALGAFAKRLGWEAWFLPVKCHHFGGLTAVADGRYHQWAMQHQRTVLNFGERKVTDVRGDQLFWEEAHRITYEKFRDVLPIRL